jgi:hypothetical protein
VQTRVLSNRTPDGVRLPATAWIAGGLLFIVLATANAAGYRYGVSDQALYIPVVIRALDPSSFPRDASLIDAQGRLMLVDEVLAEAVRLTGLELDTLFLAGYLMSLALIWAALALIGARVYQNAWATAALAAAFTLRHRIPRTSANSFEPYFHPRMLAFALGALAVAAVLRQRRWIAVGLVAAAAVIHITTAIWFAIALGVALAILDVRMRRLAIVAAAGAAAVLLWMVTAGPLRSTLQVMDDSWLRAVASKDSLFPTQWPLWAWVSNLGMAGLLWWAHRVRERRGETTPEDRALVLGALALVGVFLVTLPAVAAQVSLAVQFQVSRVFWLVDFIATIYVIGMIVGSQKAGRAFTARRAQVVALVLITASIARGAYIMLVEQPERVLFAASLPDSEWEDAMRWVARQPRDVHVLADPGHAWKFGTSARVSAAHDVLLEEVKDSALAIYSRNVAYRVVDRTSAVGDFSALDASRAAALAARYDLHYLITEAPAAQVPPLQLPVAYRNRQFVIYSLRPE